MGGVAMDLRACPSLNFNTVAKFGKEKPDTVVRILRDTIKWGDAADLCEKSTLDLTKLGSGLNNCADLLSVTSIPRTVDDLITHASGVISSDARLHHLTKTIENGCDLVSEGCDVVTAVDNLVGGVLSETAVASVSNLNSSVTVKSFSVKIMESLKEVYDWCVLDTEAMTETQRSVANEKVKESLGTLAWKVSIFALCLITILPFFVEGFAVTSTTMLMISTLGLIGSTAAFFFKENAAALSS